MRADIRAKLTAAQRHRKWQAGEPLRALSLVALGILTTRQREVVTLYYGCGSGEPLASGEIGGRLGLKPDRVRQLVRRSVVRLLGAAAEGVVGRAEVNS